MTTPSNIRSRAINAAVSVMVLAFIGFVLWMAFTHFSFKQRLVAVMPYEAAMSTGFMQDQGESGAFAPPRVWIAKLADGRYEYRVARPILGVLPFDFLGHGESSKDLMAICKNLQATNRCLLIPN